MQEQSTESSTENKLSKFFAYAAFEKQRRGVDHTDFGLSSFSIFLVEHALTKF